MRSSHSMRTEEETHTIYYFYSTVDVVVAVGFFFLSLSGTISTEEKAKMHWNDEYLMLSRWKSNTKTSGNS